MSEEQKQTARENEAGDESKPGAASAAKPDIADEDELDIEIQRVAPKKSGGCGPVGWVMFVVLLALVFIIIGVVVKRQQAAVAEKERQQREATYSATETTIGDNMRRAAEAAAKGDIDEALTELTSADKKWGELGASANYSKDTDKAAYATDKKGKLSKVLQALEADRKAAAELDAQAQELQKKRDELNAKVCQAIQGLVGSEPNKGSGGQPATTDQPAGNAEPAAAGQPAAAGEPQAQPQQPAPAAEPAAAQAPAPAPAAPTPAPAPAAP